jgi:hypothetical protein
LLQARAYTRVIPSTPQLPEYNRDERAGAKLVKLVAGWLAVVGLLAASCVNDSYECSSDAQCNIGEAGRCEVNGRCTSWDPLCPSTYRYTPHSGDLSGTCFDDRSVPANPCTAGQAPALPEGCFATVCAAAPACCETGWSETCVQLAQIHCPQRCDTRIAFSSTDRAITTLWDLRWNGVEWSASMVPQATAVSWLAPAPGDIEPRLATFVVGALVIGDASYPLPAREYEFAASVDFDRAGRDTVSLGSVDLSAPAPAPRFVELVDLSTGTSREHTVQSNALVAWGDVDHDAFPDGSIGGGNTYRLLTNEATADRRRALVVGAASQISSTATAGTVGVRGLEWADLDSNGTLDWIASGNSLRLHMSDPRPIDTGAISLDCNPVEKLPSMCMAGDSSFVSAAMPSASSATKLYLTPFPQHALYTVTVGPAPDHVVVIEQLFVDVSAPPFIALVIRDLDFDHVLDVIAIDEELTVWTGSGTGVMSLVRAFPIVPPMNGQKAQVRMSIAGAPLP